MILLTAGEEGGSMTVSTWRWQTDRSLASEQWTFVAVELDVARALTAVIHCAGHDPSN